MLKKCSNCGSKIEFAPKDKGNRCQTCGSVFPIKYNYKFKKKPFSKNVPLPVDELAESLKNIKCKSCGAKVFLNKYELNPTCPYCGDTEVSQLRNNKLMYIDSIIPFAFGRQEALSKFKRVLRNRVYTNKKAFKNITARDIKGAYISAFVFDVTTSSTYDGVFTYTETKEDENGNKTYITKTKHVSGVFDQEFKNITVEANSNLNQQELYHVLPFEYASAVSFTGEFVHGYMLEYQDKMFDDCFKVAESIVRRKIENDLLKKYNCDNIEELKLNVGYVDRQYNYCLLPVYFVNSVVKDKSYTAIINGQTGKVGKLPTDKLRVFLTVLFACGFVVATILLIFFMLK